MREKILEELKGASEIAYKEFNTKLIPGVDVSKVLGVRIPAQRVIAKKLAREDFHVYINELPEDCFYEERMIHGMILGYAKLEFEEWQRLVNDFVPLIHDWGTCDSCAMGMKQIKKHLPEGRKLINKYLKSDKEYVKRFAIVMLLAHYINDEYIEDILEQMAEVNTNKYYVMMAVAWTVSTCYIKFPVQTKNLLISGKLDDVTQNKSIQKIRE